MLFKVSKFKGTQKHESQFVSEVCELGWSDLAECVLGGMWSPGTFRNGHRTIQNFESLQLLVLDIDEGLSISEAREIFAPYRGMILTSKSHQIDKVRSSGKVSPACDRFRVILALAEPVTTDADYKATWFQVQKLCPQIDPACKDSSRFFFPCKEFVEAWDGQLFPVTKYVQPAQVTEAQLPESDTGKLAPSLRTMRFVTMGAEDGQWHQELVRACYDLKQQRWSEREATELLRKATGTLDEHDLGVIEDIWANRAPKHPPRQLNDEALVKLIKRCHMIVDIADPMRLSMVELDNGRVHDIHAATVKGALKPDEYKDYVGARRVKAQYVYNPYLDKPLSLDSETGLYVYNSYVPPSWRAPNYYRGEAIEISNDLPKLYADFFTHLTNAHKESKEYLLDWVAHSLKARNFTILTAIGEEGIGKGTMGEILKGLHGRENFSEASDSLFKSRFNGKMDSKTLVYVDEIDLKTKESQDRIKAVVNDYIEVEKKGIDATTVRNYASFYISSNSYDAVQIGGKDRRFSVIELTETPLKETSLIAYVEDMKSAENIKQLAGYLWNRNVDARKMLHPFRSKRFDEVMEAGLQDWEAWVIFQWAKLKGGQTLPIADMQNDIQVQFPRMSPPGRQKLASLAKKYPQVIRLTQRDSGERLVQVSVQPVNLDRFRPKNLT